MTPSKGLNVLHLFCHVNGDVDRAILEQAISDAHERKVQVVTAAIMGAKADLCFMVLGEDLWDLRRFQSKVQASGLSVSESYVSVTEISEYGTWMSEEMQNAVSYTHLTLPTKRIV